MNKSRLQLSSEELNSKLGEANRKSATIAWLLFLLLLSTSGLLSALAALLVVWSF